MSSSPEFVRFWRTDLTRDCFLSYASQDDLRALRLVCRDTAGPVTPYLFGSIQINFNTNTFSRRARIAALEHIGCHVKSLTFNVPHNPDTFLPPLLDPTTGMEQTFHYQPNLEAPQPSSSSSSSTSSSCRSSSPTYGTWEMNSLLIKQYPPLFHAATDIPSFIRAMTAMPSLRHVTICSPYQSSSDRYRRSIVDYALISLRIALERANLGQLTSLALSNIHPSALINLRPTTSIGATPASTRLWRGISKLSIEMEAFPSEPSSDHLKLLHAYLYSLPGISNLTFNWLGDTKGPCPFALHLEPSISQPKLDECPSSEPHPTTIKPPLRPFRFRHLSHMSLTNAVLDATQAADFIRRHRRSLVEFDFSKCELRSGTWEEALEPVTSNPWKKAKDRRKERGLVMDVPIVWSVSEQELELELEGSTEVGSRTSVEDAANLLKKSKAKAKAKGEDCVHEKLWVERGSHPGIRALKRVGGKTKGLLGGGERGVEKCGWGLKRVLGLKWK